MSALRPAFFILYLESYISRLNEILHHDLTLSVGEPDNAAAKQGQELRSEQTVVPLHEQHNLYLFFCVLTIRKHLLKMRFERSGRGQEPSRGHKFSMLEKLLSTQSSLLGQALVGAKPLHLLSQTALPLESPNGAFIASQPWPFPKPCSSIALVSAQKRRVALHSPLHPGAGIYHFHRRSNMAEMKSPNAHARENRNDTPRKRKTHIIKVRVTAEEKLRIAYACKELHLTQSELVRRVLYGVNVKHTVVVAQGGEDALAALAALSAQCSKVGSNLNQLARHFNSGGKDTEQLRAQILEELSALTNFRLKAEETVGELYGNRQAVIRLVEIKSYYSVIEIFCQVRYTTVYKCFTQFLA